MGKAGMPGDVADAAGTVEETYAEPYFLQREREKERERERERESESARESARKDGRQVILRIQLQVRSTRLIKKMHVGSF